MAKPQGVGAALERLRDLLDTENELDTAAYERRAEAREHTRIDPGKVERLLDRLDRIDSERERNRLEIRKLLKETIEPALDKPSKRTQDSIDELRAALVVCMARYAELESRLRTIEERSEPRNVTHFDSKRGTGG